jgi:hypothetical protein
MDVEQLIERLRERATKLETKAKAASFNDFSVFHAGAVIKELRTWADNIEAELASEREAYMLRPGTASGDVNAVALTGGKSAVWVVDDPAPLQPTTPSKRNLIEEAYRQAFGIPRCVAHPNWNANSYEDRPGTSGERVFATRELNYVDIDHGYKVVRRVKLIDKDGNLTWYTQAE